MPKRGVLPLLDNIETIQMKIFEKKNQFFPWLSEKIEGKKAKKMSKLFVVLCLFMENAHRQKIPPALK